MCEVIQISPVFVLFFSLPFHTYQMAVRFQTQGSGRQSRNKIAFLGRRIGLTRCQIKGFFFHTHTQTLFWPHCVCVSSCAPRRVHVFGRSMWRREVMYSNLSESVRAPPDGIVHCLIRSTTQRMPHVVTGTHECLIGLISNPGEDVQPPLQDFKYSY